MITDILQTFLIAMLVFVPLEHILPRDASKPILRESWTLDTAYALLAGILVAMGYLLVILSGGAVLNLFLSEVFKNSVSQQPIILQILAIMVIVDIVYYWVHRAFHQVPWLWRIHAVHHSIENMDWLASHRVHPVDQVLTRGGSLILPFALGFDTAALGIWALATNWHSLLNHSNINLKFGPLRWLIVSPTYHHWHHANEEHAFDKNFAGQLPVLDIIFGTAIMDETSGPQSYGTDTHVPDHFVDQMMVPFKETQPEITSAAL